MPHFFRNSFLALILCASAFVLPACSGTTVGLGAAAVGSYLTKPGEPPPANTVDQIAQHDSWCYKTMGYAECYSQPQDVEPNRLINVEPQSKYPLTPRAYHEAVIEGQ